MAVKATRHNPQSGSVIVYVLLAVALLGAVTIALQKSGMEGANIDREALTIQVAQVRQNASELERAANLVMQNRISESDISFAHENPAANAYGTYGDNPRAEIFNPKGGGAAWRNAPDGVTLTATPWFFYGSTHAPGVGSERADLIAVLPNVTRAFCDAVNKINGQPIEPPPSDSGACLHGGAVFTPTSGFSDSADTMDESSFAQGESSAIPARQGCVSCGGDYHFYHVLLAR